jgi:putative FmdB family regulatory protein
MPLYEYECGACGHRFEIIQKFSDAPVTECPDCQGRLRKLQSAPAFQLKGTGWYATDYPKAGQATADKDSGGSSESSASEAAVKGDKSEKNGKSDKTEKSQTEKSDKSEKTGTVEKKTERKEKTDKTKSVKSEGSSLKKTDTRET